MENNTATQDATPMDDQDFYEFRTTVDGSAVSYENQANGTTIITCEDGTKLIVTADGDSKPIKTRESEYDELRSAGLTDHQIKMLRNTGASHRAILLWAKQRKAPK